LQTSKTALWKQKWFHLFQNTTPILKECDDKMKWEKVPAKNTSKHKINLLQLYLIKGLSIPLVGIKHPTISTNLLKHSNTRKGE
jgi:hypothetical protein